MTAQGERPDRSHTMDEDHQLAADLAYQVATLVVACGRGGGYIMSAERSVGFIPSVGATMGSSCGSWP